MKTSGATADLPPITAERFIWHPIVDGLGHDVPVDVLTVPGATELGTEQTHLYLGMGEGKFATRAGLRVLGTMSIAAVGIVLPFHHLPANAANIERVLKEVPIALAAEMNGRAGNALDREVSLLGHSQSGGAVLLAAGEAPELFDIVGAWAPVGLTSEYFGSTAREKRIEFFRRLLLENSFRPEQNLIRYPTNLIAGSEIMSRVIADGLARRLFTKVDYALGELPNAEGQMLDLRRSVKALGEYGRDVRIFGGATDPLFRPDEYRASLTEFGLEDVFEEVPGSHASPMVSAGRAQLKIVAAWVQTRRKIKENT